MNFRLIKASLVQLLGDHADGKFRVAGYQKRGQSAVEISNYDRIVQVYYAAGQFPKSGGGPSGPVKHDMTFNLDLFVSMKTQGNLQALNNPASSASQLQTAIADLKIAEDLVDSAFDEFAEDCFQIVMNALHLWLGHNKPVGSRWVPAINKDDPVRYGELVTLSGTMPVTCNKDEQVKGATPVLMQVIDTEVIPNEDEVGKAGVIVGFGDYVTERGTLNNVKERGTGALVVDREA